MLKYKLNLEDTLTRLKKFYNRECDEILVSMNIKSGALEEFASEYKAGECERPELRKRIRFWNSYFKERQEITDDTVPSAYLSELDQGLYGGLLGGDVRFIADPGNGWISSMVFPLLNDWSEFDDLKITDESEWFQFYLKQLEVFLEGANGKFGISHFILIDSLNFIFELRGATNTYLDIIDNPERVKEAVKFAFKLNTWVQDIYFEKAGLLQGGTCSNIAQWIPGKIISESLDPFHMASPDYFEEWGRENVERMFSYYDGGIIHIHANGRHLLENASTLKGLKAIALLDDIGFPTAFSLRYEMKEKLGDIPIIINVEYDEFIKELKDKNLPGGILYIVNNVPDVYQANKCYQLVRKG